MRQMPAAMLFSAHLEFYKLSQFKGVSGRYFLQLRDALFGNVGVIGWGKLMVAYRVLLYRAKLHFTAIVGVK